MLSSVLATVTLLAASVTAQTSCCTSCVKSAPFNLVVESSNNTLNGRSLIACHTGAAIESFCLTSGTPSAFYHNTSSCSVGTDSQAPTGILAWTLMGGNFNVSEPMSFSIDPASNVALPLLEPGTGNAQQVAFTSNATGGYLAVPQYLDDTVVPAAYVNQTLLQRWYICQTNYAGYRYTNLAWTLGNGTPQNPTCQSVKVRRVFL